MPVSGPSGGGGDAGRFPGSMVVVSRRDRRVRFVPRLLRREGGSREPSVDSGLRAAAWLVPFCVRVRASRQRLPLVSWHEGVAQIAGSSCNYKHARRTSGAPSILLGVRSGIPAEPVRTGGRTHDGRPLDGPPSTPRGPATTHRRVDALATPLRVGEWTDRGGNTGAPRAHASHWPSLRGCGGRRRGSHALPAAPGARRCVR